MTSLQVAPLLGGAAALVVEAVVAMVVVISEGPSDAPGQGGEHVTFPEVHLFVTESKRSSRQFPCRHCLPMQA